MNYNSENIIGVPLAFVDYNTGELQQGKFIRKKTKIQTVIRFEFKNKKLQNAVINLDYKFFNTIDVIDISKFKDIPVSSYFLYIFDKIIHTTSLNNSNRYVGFTNLEVAKKFRKEVMIPSIIDSKHKEAKQLKNQYFKLAEEIELLEKALKKL